MVAMQVRDKHGAYLCEAHFLSAQLQLCALATVDHKHFAPHLNDLCRGVMAHGGQGAATA